LAIDVHCAEHRIASDPAVSAAGKQYAASHEQPAGHAGRARIRHYKFPNYTHRPRPFDQSPEIRAHLPLCRPPTQRHDSDRKWASSISRSANFYEFLPVDASRNQSTAKVRPLR
jgi:hypothetical protein